MAAVVGLIALHAVLPISFGNLLPAWAAMLFAMVVVLHGSVAVLLVRAHAAPTFFAIGRPHAPAWTLGSEGAWPWIPTLLEPTTP